MEDQSKKLDGYYEIKRLYEDKKLHSSILWGKSVKKRLVMVKHRITEENEIADQSKKLDGYYEIKKLYEDNKNLHSSILWGKSVKKRRLVMVKHRITEENEIAVHDSRLKRFHGDRRQGKKHHRGYKKLHEISL